MEKVGCLEKMKRAKRRRTGAMMVRWEKGIKIGWQGPWTVGQGLYTASPRHDTLRR